MWRSCTTVGTNLTPVLVLALGSALVLAVGCDGDDDDDSGMNDDDVADDDDATDDDDDDTGGGDDDDSGAGDDDDDATDDDDDTAAVNECGAGWQGAHPEWVFCDDFEGVDPLVGDGRYFEHGDDEGDFDVADGVGVGGSRGMQAVWQAGEVDAGSLKVGFGRNPSGYMDTGIRPGEDFREIYVRLYLRNQAGWSGDPAKLTRTTVIAGDDWSQAMIAHLWGDGDEHLLLDPASCVDGSGHVLCEGYNDFGHLDWLGYAPGTTAVFSGALADTWFCVEHHVLLDDPGAGNGVQEFWIDGGLEARRDGLTFVGSYGDYALNAVFFENYWNDGSSQDQERYLDNFVISTAPIGCL